MRQINIKTIPHTDQRYPTVGDYWLNQEGVEELRVSDLKNPDHEFLVAIHELVEWYLTEKRGIAEETIKEFDEKFEAERASGLHDKFAEPGFDERAPYHYEHAFAEKIERQIATELGVDWGAYGQAIADLDK